MKILPFDRIRQPLHSGHRGWMGHNPNITIVGPDKTWDFIWYCAWGDSPSILEDMAECRKHGRCIFNITGDHCYVPKEDRNNFYFVTATNPMSTCRQMQVPYSYHASLDWMVKNEGKIIDKTYLANFQGSFGTWPARRHLMEMSAPDIWIKECDGWISKEEDRPRIIEEHDRLLAQSYFTLCPRGIGGSSIRVVEAILRGSLPVLMDDYSKLFGEEMEFCLRFPMRGNLADIKQLMRSVVSSDFAYRELIAGMKNFSERNLLIDLRSGCVGTIGYSEIIRKEVQKWQN